MYGYIQICKPELKFREYDVYRSYYCGLCRKLRTCYGMTGQFLLSYDLTFLTLLLDGLYEPEETVWQGRCIAHPLRKQHFVQSEGATAYAADMSLLLTAYKLEDDWKDEKKHIRHLLGKLLSGKTGAVRSAYLGKAERIEAALHTLSQLEQAQCQDPEPPASCFGQILAEVLAYREDVWEEKLREMGFHLGRFIYLADAFDDLEHDQKHGCYNPFLHEDAHDPAFHTACESLLRLMIAPAADAFAYLPIVKHAEILRNILYAGVWTAFRRRRSQYQSGNDGASQGGTI
jgi:hypothetical protein